MSDVDMTPVDEGAAAEGDAGAPAAATGEKKRFEVKKVRCKATALSFAPKQTHGLRATPDVIYFLRLFFSFSSFSSFSAFSSFSFYYSTS